jgi:hypothetical protein
MAQIAVVKVFWYTEQQKNIKEQIDQFAQHVEENYKPGKYLIKVWDKGQSIGFFKVA